MRAEYARTAPSPESGGEQDAEAGTERAVVSWHMVRGRASEAMCGRELSADAELRPDADWGRTDEPMCHTCGALYLREVP